MTIQTRSKQLVTKRGEKERKVDRTFHNLLPHLRTRNFLIKRRCLWEYESRNQDCAIRTIRITGKRKRERERERERALSSALFNELRFYVHCETTN